MSQEDVRARLGAYRWELSRQETVRSVSGGEALRVSALRTPRFDHLGCSGDLVLTFLDDRLWSATFSPENGECYRLALRRDGVEIKPQRSVQRVTPQTELTVIAAAAGRPTFHWSDIELSKRFGRSVD